MNIDMNDLNDIDLNDMNNDTTTDDPTSCIPLPADPPDEGDIAREAIRRLFAIRPPEPPADLLDLRRCLYHVIKEATPARYPGIEQMPDKLTALLLDAKLAGHLPLKGQETLHSVADEARFFLQASALRLIGLLNHEYKGPRPSAEKELTWEEMLARCPIAERMLGRF